MQADWEVESADNNFLSDWWDYVTLAAAGLCCASSILLWCTRRRREVQHDPRPAARTGSRHNQYSPSLAAPLLTFPPAHTAPASPEVKETVVERSEQEIEVWKDTKEDLGLDVDQHGLICRVKAGGAAMRAGGQHLIGRRLTHVEGDPVDGRDVDILASGKTSVRLRLAPTEPAVTFAEDTGCTRPKSAPLLEKGDVDLTKLCEAVAISHVPPLLRAYGILTASDCSPDNMAAAGVRPIDRRILVAALGDPVKLAAAGTRQRFDASGSPRASPRASPRKLDLF